MNSTFLLDALEYIDTELIENADQIPPKTRNRFPVRWRAVAAILAVCLIIGIVHGIQYIRNRQVCDVRYPGIRADFYIYGTEELVEKADAIFEGIVLDITFEAEKQSHGDDYHLDTIYTVAVTRTYKGDASLIAKIHTGFGLRDYKLKEQLEALRKAGAPETYRTIPVLDDLVTPKIGSTYLFCVREWRGEYGAINPVQYAMAGDSELPSYSKYNPKAIKEHLPYVPHPLLILAVLGGAAAATVLVIRVRKKKKKTDSD